MCTGSFHFCRLGLGFCDKFPTAVTSFWKSHSPKEQSLTYQIAEIILERIVTVAPAILACLWKLNQQAHISQSAICRVWPGPVVFFHLLLKSVGNLGYSLQDEMHPELWAYMAELEVQMQNVLASIFCSKSRADSRGWRRSLSCAQRTDGNLHGTKWGNTP